MRDLKCAACGAPLSLARENDAGIITCEYCEREHHALREAPSPANPRAVFKVGDSVHVLWGSRWWPAQILRVVAEDIWEIHYVGWSDEWDEIVDVARVRAAGAAPVAGGRSAGIFLVAIGLAVLAGIAAGVVLLRAPASPPTASPEQLDAEAARGPITPTGQALPEGLFVPTGTPLEVQWNQSFYRATNKTQYGDGTLAVHYEGWSDSFDEIVEPERVRLSEQAIVAARGPVEGSGPTLDAESPVYPGDVIEVRWRDAYYRAVVRATHPDGRLRVHYAGWPEAWDEDVPRERARRVLSAGD